MYQSTQIWRIAIFSFLIVIIWLVYSYKYRIKEPQRTHKMLFITLASVMFIMWIITYRLQVIVDEENFSFFYWPWKIIWARFPIENILSCEVVKNNRRHGYFGVRRLNNTVFFNASWLDAIELEIKDFNPKMRIWANYPQKICKEIDKRQNSRKYIQ